MHILLLLIATICKCKSATYHKESNAVSSFVESLLGYSPGGNLKSFCRPAVTQTMVYKGVEYTCEMNDEEQVTKLAIVAFGLNHRYLPRSGILEGIYYLFHSKTNDAFNIKHLKKLHSLTHLYP